MYHRVAESPADPLELCVTPSRFAEHLELLQSAGEIVPLRELLSARRGSGPRFALTFDDGYADNALEAAPLLAKHDAHATVFVVAGAVGSGRAFWWDRLASLLYRDGDSSAYWSAWERLRRLTVPEVEEELASLEREHGPAAPTDGARPVSEAELATLASGPVEIGGHTITHPSLPVLGLDEQEREIADGRVRLEELLGRPLETFSYPYGDHDEGTVRLVEQTGFRLACSVEEGFVSPHSSPFLLPRCAVRDWPVEELERRLSTWR
jgi:peptidoglycan/xylan/chitin deacetylase (PgdA/CDA1 family)